MKRDDYMAILSPLLEKHYVLESIVLGENDEQTDEADGVNVDGPLV